MLWLLKVAIDTVTYTVGLLFLLWLIGVIFG